jgi:hypothetical protein
MRLGSGRKEMNLSNTTQLVLVAVVFLIIGVLAAMALTRVQRTKQLKERFGPEYERAMNEKGNKRQAEDELAARLAHVNALQIRPLTADEVNRYALDWQETQTEFVDEPLTALQKADHLIREVMKAKGYPVEDFEQRAADISVDYPELVTDYRGLHLIAVKQKEDDVSTEEMRQAMVHGRALFENLISKDTNIETTAQKERI